MQRTHQSVFFNTCMALFLNSSCRVVVVVTGSEFAAPPQCLVNQLLVAKQWIWNVECP